MYKKKAIGRNIKQKMPARFRTECAICDKYVTCRQVAGVWYCVAVCADKVEREREKTL